MVRLLHLGGVADVFGLPVSITEVLMALVLALPAAVCLSASLYVLFPNLF